MKISAANTQAQLSNTNLLIKEAVATPQKGNSAPESFMDRLEDGLQQVARTQNDAANLAKNYELCV